MREKITSKKYQNFKKKFLTGFTLEEVLQAIDGKLIQGKRDCNFPGISINTRTIKRKELFIAIKGNNLNGHDFIKLAVKKGARGVVVSQNLNFKLPESFLIIRVEDTTAALGSIAKFHRQRFKIPVVAVTGSNGKTTTKEMLSSVLKSKFKVLSSYGTFNNHIGIPLTLLRLKPVHKVAVLELGTSHPGEIGYLAGIAMPTVAIITNIGPSHLEFFKDLENVFKEKISLIKNLKIKSAIIINSDDKYLGSIENNKVNCRVIKFGIRNRADFYAQAIELKNEHIKFVLNGRYPVELNSPAKHNVYNCLAVIACCKYLGLDYNCIQKQIRKFSFPSGRLEIKQFSGIKIIDDTYNANPASFRSAIDVLANYNSSGRKVMVCADMFELGNSSGKLHFSLGESIGTCGVDILVGVGKLAGLICCGARKSGMKNNSIFHFPSTEIGVKKINRLLRPKDICLVKGSRLMRMEKIVEAIKKARI